jgi:hypothetical protein
MPFLVVLRRLHIGHPQAELGVFIDGPLTIHRGVHLEHASEEYQTVLRRR